MIQASEIEARGAEFVRDKEESSKQAQDFGEHGSPSQIWVHETDQVAQN
jgi:hypothetical protein